MYNTVYLKKGKEESLGRFHPWVFSGAIHHIEGRPEEGDVVRILSADGRFLAVGHIQIGSIAVRVLSFEDITIDRSFWYQRLSAAYDVRKSIFPQWADGNKDGKLTNAFRLVHGEGDGLPGLVIDVYDRTAVMQAHSVGMHVSRHEIADALAEVLEGVVENIYYKSENTLAYKASEDGGNGFLKGGLATADDIAVENGLRFHVDWLGGQKTGFFVDQRENRALLERYSHGRKVLNMFCYTGGFSFYAMRGGAELVHSVDSSSRAIDITRANVELNFPGDHVMRRMLRMPSSISTAWATSMTSLSLTHQPLPSIKMLCAMRLSAIVSSMPRLSRRFVPEVFSLPSHARKW